MDKKSTLRNGVENFRNWAALALRNVALLRSACCFASDIGVSKLTPASLGLRNIHTLFADALDFVLEFDGEGGDVSVLALGAERVRFAAHFLEDETKVLALGAAFGECVEEQLVVAAEPRDFFVDVEFIGHDAGFLQKADFVDFGIFHERVDAFAELDLPRFDALRIEDFDLVDDVVQVVDTTGEVCGEVYTFFFTHRDDSVQSLVEFRFQVLFPKFVIVVSVGELQNFGDGEHMFQLDFACNAVLGLHRLRDFHELFHGSFVVANGNVPGVACAKRNRKIHGTANELVLDLGFKIVFEVGKILRNLARNFEETAVHAAHFDNARDSLQCGFAFSEPGHGDNGHFILSRLSSNLLIVATTCSAPKFASPIAVRNLLILWSFWKCKFSILNPSLLHNV